MWLLDYERYYMGNSLIPNPSVSPSPPLTILDLGEPRKTLCLGTGTAMVLWGPE